MPVSFITASILSVFTPRRDSIFIISAIGSSASSTACIKSGLSANSGSLTVSEDPNWTTAAGTLATVSDGLGTSQTVGTLVAAAGAGGGTLVYSSDDSTFDTSYFVLNSSTGVVTTHASTAISALTSGGNYTESFNANASISGDATKNTVRAFNIIVREDPSGGTLITSISGYQFHVFKTIGSTNFVVPSTKNMDYLIVGGGGGGSFGGGGAGGFRENGGTPISVSANTYSIVVGAGGASTSPVPATVGGNSSALGQTATGGGYGGGVATNYGVGGNGGSGGGGGHAQGGPSSGTGDAGGTGINDGGTFGTATFQGYAGGAGKRAPNYGGGGGGGASEVGATATGTSSNSGGYGGDGRSTVWGLSAADTTTIWAACSVGVVGYGESIRYLGGGGGGSYFTGTYDQNISGGKGGGGDGGQNTTSGSDGATNTGGGGGGNNGNKHVGGSGIVIIRYAV